MNNKIFKKLYIETYGCQMNFSDSEIVSSIMTEKNYEITHIISDADLVLINTCSIRDHAEQRVLKRLKELNNQKKKNPELQIGILGCMAERLKEKLLEEEQNIDIIVGPDSYRDLPYLMTSVENGKKAINVILSSEETYDDIKPVRLDKNKVSAFISIMRGCQNYCAYCVVPYTRGKERSRDPETIINEARDLFAKGYREVTLLGQNVNSYFWGKNTAIDFPDLLEQIGSIHPLLRVRFATSHPKDISDKLIQTIAKYKNICNAIHLPVQSGSNKILKMMNRKYDREQYLERISTIKKYIPDCAITTDIISGFCTETEEDHKQTLSLMQDVGFDYAFMFKYSERPNTLAAEKYKDDVPEKIKSRRLTEVINLQRKLSYNSNLNDIGKTFEVLIEGFSKKSNKQLSGRNSQNKVIIFPQKSNKIGDYAHIKVTDCNSATLIGE